MNDLLKKIQHIRIEDYTYQLDEDRIAKFPVVPRDASRLLLYKKGDVSETTFHHLPDHLPSDSLLVYNNTRVIHARLFFYKETGARIEIFCLEPLRPADYAQNFQSTDRCEWLCMVGNLKKWKAGTLTHTFNVKGKSIRLTAEKQGYQTGAQRICFTWCESTETSASTKDYNAVSFGDLLETAGQLPIPPYLNRETETSDETGYQTVFSRIEGSVAAPTAGLHFTPKVLSAIDRKNILRAEVTLHVGAGTFQPVLASRISDHAMHSEFISVDRSLIEHLIRHLGRITAVGTTSVRTLESLYWFGFKLIKNPETAFEVNTSLDQWYAYRQTDADGKLLNELTPRDALQALVNHLEKNNQKVFTASTRLLIAPGYSFRMVNAMLTNFHQPNSTLLLLVAAFLGNDEWKKVYNYALSHSFRFLSYGDGSLLVP